MNFSRIEIKRNIGWSKNLIFSARKLVFWGAGININVPFILSSNTKLNSTEVTSFTILSLSWFVAYENVHWYFNFLPEICCLQCQLYTCVSFLCHAVEFNSCMTSHRYCHFTQNAYLKATHVYYFGFGNKLALENHYIPAFYTFSNILLYLPFSNFYVHNTYLKLQQQQHQNDKKSVYFHFFSIPAWPGLSKNHLSRVPH